MDTQYLQLSLLWLASVTSDAGVRPVTYCPPDHCLCHVLVICKDESQSNLEAKCTNLGMSVVDVQAPDLDLSGDLENLISLMQMIADSISSTFVTCSLDMGSYDEKGLDKESRVWDGELCDLHSVETVDVITKCSPKCSYNSDSDHEALASKLLSYWETSNITPGGGCSEDEVSEVECCLKDAAAPDWVDVVWNYDLDQLRIDLRIFCKNKHQRHWRTSNKVIGCENSPTEPWNLTMPDDHCIFDDCMIDEDNGVFTQTLNDDLAEAMGTHVALVGDYDGPKVIVSDDIPWLKITCFIDNGLTKDIQFARCDYLYKEGEALRDNPLDKWEWDLSTLKQCSTEDGKGLDFRQYQNYLSTFVMREAAQCLIISYDRAARGKDHCPELGYTFFKPSMPYQQGGTNSEVYKFLRQFGRHYWLGHYLQFDGGNVDAIWPDDTQWDWAASPLTKTEYQDLSNTKYCFTLDNTNAAKFGLEDCASQYRELCSVPVDLEDVAGSWSDWNEWSVCGNLRRTRTMRCSAGSDFCRGCDGVVPTESEICCNQTQTMEGAVVSFTGTSVHAECFEGRKISGSEETTVTYSCLEGSDWLTDNNNPKCELDPCDNPPSPTSSSSFADGYNQNGDYRVGAWIVYDCLPNLIVTDTANDRNKTLTCLTNASWDGLAPECTGQPFHINEEFPYQHLLWNITAEEYRAYLTVMAGRRRVDGAFYAGDSLTLECQEGYEFDFEQPTSIINVTADGFQGKTQCELIKCKAPPDPPKHSVIISGWGAQAVGSSITYQCLPGFEDRARRLTRVTFICSEDRIWTSKHHMLNCASARCPSPELVKNGVIDGLKDSNTYYTADVITIVCDPGYGVKIGERYVPAAESRCNSEGDWSKSAESREWCTLIKCPKITNIINADVLSARESWELGEIGENVTVQCYPDHVLIGSHMEEGLDRVVQTCLEDGTWTGYDEYHCYTYKLQYGPIVDVYPENPGKITITWLNTDLFLSDDVLEEETVGEEEEEQEAEQEGEPEAEPTADGEVEAVEDNEPEEQEEEEEPEPTNRTQGDLTQYIILFIGKDRSGTVRANFTLQHEAPRSHKIYRMVTRVPPGFLYSMWIAGTVNDWKESFYGEADVEFYSPTGIPAFAQGFTLEDMTPLMNKSYVSRDFLLDETKIVVDIKDIFSPINGSVHSFTLIVLERNEFLPEQYMEGTLEKDLHTWAKARQFPYWPPYIIHEKCQLFTGVGCPDIISGLSSFQKEQYRLKREAERNASYYSHYSARDPIFMGEDDWGVRETGMEDVSIDNDNLRLWVTPGARQSDRTASYTIGAQTCYPDEMNNYCNGKLKYTGKFCVKLRAYTNDHYIDSPCAKTDELTSPDSLVDKWEQAKLGPLGFSLVPLSMFLSVVVGLLLNREDVDSVTDKEMEELRAKKRSEKARMRWRNAIFKAYDKALTADNDEAVNLLAVASAHNTAVAKTSRAPLNLVRGLSSLKLERRCSYFTRYRPWFEEMRDSALERHISLTSLSIKSDGEEEIYNPNHVVVEQHIPYDAYQHGRMVRGFQVTRGSRTPKKK